MAVCCTGCQTVSLAPWAASCRQLFFFKHALTAVSLSKLSSSLTFAKENAFGWDFQLLGNRSAFVVRAAPCEKHPPPTPSSKPSVLSQHSALYKKIKKIKLRLSCCCDVAIFSYSAFSYSIHHTFHHLQPPLCLSGIAKQESDIYVLVISLVVCQRRSYTNSVKSEASGN